MRRIVLKFGTGTLSRSAGRALHASLFRRIAGEISLLVKAGNSCVIVSSAAIAAGVHMLGAGPPSRGPSRQAGLRRRRSA